MQYCCNYYDMQSTFIYCFISILKELIIMVYSEMLQQYNYRHGQKITGILFDQKVVTFENVSLLSNL